MFMNIINIRNSRERPLREGRGRDAEGGGTECARRNGWVGEGWSPAHQRFFDWLKSGAVGLLLLSVVVSVIFGSGMALFVTMVVAWSLFPVLVAFRNVLDAGCAFMLISVGILVVVGVAQHGLDYLMP
jgi:hypothetical protein